MDNKKIKDNEETGTIQSEVYKTLDHLADLYKKGDIKEINNILKGFRITKNSSKYPSVMSLIKQRAEELPVKESVFDFLLKKIQN